MIKINSKTIDYNSKWLKVIKKNIEMYSNSGDYYSVELFDYITCITFTEDKKFVLVKQYRHAIESMSLEFPSGLLDTKETPEECAIKEVWEETGLKVKKIISLGTYFADVGRLTNKIHYFFCITNSSTEAKSQEEEISLEIINPDELNGKINSGEFSFSMHIGAMTLLNNKIKDWKDL